MEARSSRLKRISRLKRVALALAVAGIAVPTAQAKYPSEGLGPSAALTSSSAPSVLIRGDDKTGLHAIAQESVVIRGDDKTGVRNIGPVPVVAAPADTVGFDWRDAGIGAAGAFALALLGASGMVALRRSRGKSGLATA